MAAPERIAILFADSSTKMPAAHIAQRLESQHYRVVSLMRDEEDIFFWLHQGEKQREAVEVCCGRTFPPEPWLADKITHLMVEMAEEGLLPVMPATCISLNPVLNRLSAKGFAAVGLTTLQEMTASYGAINRTFSFLVVAVDERHRKALLRRWAQATLILPAAPEPAFAHEVMEHVHRFKSEQAHGLTLFSPKRLNDARDFYAHFYSHLGAFYEDFFGPDSLREVLAACLARTNVAVMRRLRKKVPIEAALPPHPDYANDDECLSLSA
jgi:hypothetical protein